MKRQAARVGRALQFFGMNDQTDFRFEIQACDRIANASQFVQ